jgi:ubiquinone/menaquinone biosynthesis C-methylase UbiE
MSLISYFHKKMVNDRRISALTKLIASSLNGNEHVLDIGCGDGEIDFRLMQQMPDLQIEGIDLMVRQNTRIRVTGFDGKRIPFNDKTFDTSLLIDVLHHTHDPSLLLNEAVRVTKKQILIKDHLKSGLISETLLRMMDYAGNAHHGVTITYKYLTWEEWNNLFDQSGLKKSEIIRKLQLYSIPLTFLFDSNLHLFMNLQVEKHR